jgi:hypothetical protein
MNQFMVFGCDFYLIYIYFVVFKTYWTFNPQKQKKHLTFLLIIIKVFLVMNFQHLMTPNFILFIIDSLCFWKKLQKFEGFLEKNASNFAYFLYFQGIYDHFSIA